MLLPVSSLSGIIEPSSGRCTVYCDSFAQGAHGSFMVLAKKEV